MGGWRTLVSAAATLLLLTTTTGQAVACRKPDVYPNGDDISRLGIHDVVVRAELIDVFRSLRQYGLQERQSSSAIYWIKIVQVTHNAQVPGETDSLQAGGAVFAVALETSCGVYLPWKFEHFQIGSIKQIVLNQISGAIWIVGGE